VPDTSAMHPLFWCSSREGLPQTLSGSSTNTSLQPSWIPSGRLGLWHLLDTMGTRRSCSMTAGSEPLDLILSRPLDLTRFLHLGISLAAALGQVHRHGLIHKDVKPANVLVDAAGNVRLTGFGIASRLTREHQAPEAPEVIAGTLAYMAPEQTGRMNRSIDSRSDLYSLGAHTLRNAHRLSALYGLGSDGMGPLPYCETARAARRAVVPDVPAPISAIILKLLAKTAEERYQTAAGVEADLRRCLAEWGSRTRIDTFLLGSNDTPDRLLIPEKLYGRECEIDSLRAAFDRVVVNGTPELVLVSGYSGIGKSSVVNELLQGPCSASRSFRCGQVRPIQARYPVRDFGTGLADPGPSDPRQERSRGRPMAPCADGGDRAEWPANRQPGSGGGGHHRETAARAELQPRDAQNRFQMVFRRFLGAFARPEHPLALFLDDLQWLDAATLDVLEHLLTHSEVRHLLLVGAYRDNEVSPSHPLLRTLQTIRKAGARGPGDRARAPRTR